MGGTVGLHGPDFHFAQTLSAKLRLTAQRLLGHERIRTDRARMDLVIDQVMEFEHVHDADGDRLVKGFTGAAVIQGGLAGFGESRFFQEGTNLSFFRAVENRGRHVQTLRENRRAAASSSVSLASLK